MRKEGRIPADILTHGDDKTQGMRIQDWMTVGNLMQMLTRQLQNMPCHTILTGHIGREKDELTGGFIRTILLPGQSQNTVPINVPELLVLKKTHGPGGMKRVLLTEDDGEYRASTRLGGGKLSHEEEPDLTALLLKCGVKD